MRAAVCLLMFLPLASAQDKPERYANMPAEAVPYRNFTKPYKEWYLAPETLEYNGAARDRDTREFLKHDTVNLGFLGPVEANPEMPYGLAMLHGAKMAIEKANSTGGYRGPDGRNRPYKLMIHNDSAQWGASSTEIVKMDFDEHILSVLGSVDGTSTHIMLRVCLKLEIPIMDTGTTDPTVTETRIPWLIHNFPDDRQQGYALADYVFKQRKLQRIGVLRTQSRYARVGVRKFFDEAQRLGHTPVLESKFERGDKDFSVQLRMLKNARVQGIVIWAEAADAAAVLKQMRSLGMNQPVFGPSRLAYPELIEKAGAAAEGVVTTIALDPTRSDPSWLAFVQEYKTKYHTDPDAYAAYGYDGMSMMIDAVAKAGLNRGAIMDAFREYGAHTYEGVAGQSKFDYTLNNIAPVKLARVEHGQFVYGMPYAQIDREAVSFNGPGRESAADIVDKSLTVGFVGPLQSDVLKFAQEAVVAENVRGFPNHQRLTLAAEDEAVQWGKVSDEIAHLALDQNALALVTAGKRETAHEAEQIANKIGLPVLTLAEDPTLNQVNIPWIFRLPPHTNPSEAIHLIASALRAAGPNRARVCDWLAANGQFDHAGNPSVTH
jgi:branched-chain amino acid transport system substrate-binding protein